MKKNPTYTKRGPGRRHLQGRPTEQKGDGFRGVTFAPARPLSILHPEVRARLRAVQKAGDWRAAEVIRQGAM